MCLLRVVALCPLSMCPHLFVPPSLCVPVSLCPRLYSPYLTELRLTATSLRMKFAGSRKSLANPSPFYRVIANESQAEKSFCDFFEMFKKFARFIFSQSSRRVVAESSRVSRTPRKFVSVVEMQFSRSSVR